MDSTVPVVTEILSDMKRTVSYCAKFFYKLFMTKKFKRMKIKGKVVLGIMIFSAGKLSNRIDECLQYPLSQDYVYCFTIGVEDII